MEVSVSVRGVESWEGMQVFDYAQHFVPFSTSLSRRVFGRNELWFSPLALYRFSANAGPSTSLRFAQDDNLREELELQVHACTNPVEMTRFGEGVRASSGSR